MGVRWWTPFECSWSTIRRRSAWPLAWCSSGPRGSSWSARPRPARSRSTASPSCVPDLVLMDINMPGINGIEATRQIVAAKPETVVFLCSTYQLGDLPADAATSGARAYVNKEELGPDVLRPPLGRARRRRRLRQLTPPLLGPQRVDGAQPAGLAGRPEGREDRRAERGEDHAGSEDRDDRGGHHADRPRRRDPRPPARDQAERQADDDAEHVARQTACTITAAPTCPWPNPSALSTPSSRRRRDLGGVHRVQQRGDRHDREQHAPAPRGAAGSSGTNRRPRSTVGSKKACGNERRSFAGRGSGSTPSRKRTTKRLRGAGAAGGRLPVAQDHDPAVAQVAAGPDRAGTERPADDAERLRRLVGQRDPDVVTDVLAELVEGRAGRARSRRAGRAADPRTPGRRPRRAARGPPA